MKKNSKQKISELINKKEYIVKKLNTETNKLYGSVKPTEISKLIQETDKIKLNLQNTTNSRNKINKINLSKNFFTL